MKSFGVRFYQGVTINQDGEDPQKQVSDLFLDLANHSRSGQPLPQIEDEGQANEIRELEVLPNGKLIQGVLALVRDDAPHIREANGSERPIALFEDEGLIEKNYFLYYTEQQLLVWQVNGRASHVSRFERYLTNHHGITVRFLDILQHNAYDRLQDGMIKSLRLRVANVKNPSPIDPNDWESGLFELMSGAGGTSIDIKVSTRQKGKGLLKRLTDTIRRVGDRDDVRALQVRIDGQAEPIDLLAERISERIQVEMAGHYPIPRDILHEMAKAKERQNGALEASLGSGKNVLV